MDTGSIPVAMPMVLGATNSVLSIGWVTLRLMWLRPGPQKVRCGPATVLLPSHSLRCHVS